MQLQLISNQCSELHREPRRQFIWTNGSFGPIIGWLQSLLLIALVIAKIWLSNRILQEWFAPRGPCNLCRLSARLANSTYSWKNNQEDSGVLGSKSSQGAGKFSENSKCYQHRAQRGRPSSSFLTDWVTAQKRRKPGRYTTHPRVAFLFKQLNLLSSFTSLVKHPCPTSWRLNMRRMIMLSCWLLYRINLPITRADPTICYVIFISFTLNRFLLNL